MGNVLATKTKRKVTEGRYYPLGATLTRDGVNFALHSRNAREVFLLLFDRPDGDPTDIIRLENQAKYVWYARVQGAKAGQLYGYKVRGDYDPARGMDLDADGQADITWFGTDGTRPNWDDPELRTLCYQLDGSEAGPGREDYQLFFILNADSRAQTVKLPPLPAGKRWRRAIDTSLPGGNDFPDAGTEVPVNPADSYLAAPRSTVAPVG